MKDAPVHQNYDVCIVGAGVAGAALAAYLGDRGMKVAVVEKSMSERDVIIGELLQPGGAKKLRDMQLGFLLDGIDAQPVTGYALFLNGRNFEISYPEEAHKTVEGYGFRNGKFVQNIRNYISKLDGVTVIEASVTALEESPGGRICGVKYLKEDREETIHASLTVVCEGAFSVFREKLSNSEKKVSGFFLGMILKDADLPYPGHGHVIVAEPSPFLCYPISATETRILIDFPGSQPPRKSPELKAHLLEKVGAQVPEQLKPSFIAAVEEGKFKVMPNHWMPAAPVMKDGAVLLGDSLNMRHPLTGGGMTVALTDVENLGSRLVAAGDLSQKEKLAEAIRGFYDTRHHHSATINILADALYGVMSSDDLKDACYNYLQRGGAYAAEPISILSAVSRDQKMLQGHFFAVARYGAWHMLSPFPTPSRIRRAWCMMRDAVHIISPLILNEKPSWWMRSALKASRIFM